LFVAAGHELLDNSSGAEWIPIEIEEARDRNFAGLEFRGPHVTHCSSVSGECLPRSAFESIGWAIDIYAGIVCERVPVVPSDGDAAGGDFDAGVALVGVVERDLVLPREEPAIAVLFKIAVDVCLILEDVGDETSGLLARGAAWFPCVVEVGGVEELGAS